MAGRVALVLGSGGARGYAQIGAIQVLRERGYTISGIAGTSMGAVIGGLQAVGKLDDYTDWVTSLGPRDVLRLLDPSPFGAGAIKLERVLARMTEMLGGARIEDLPVPYTAIATDLGARREVWFTSGPVDVAIRASVAIPGVIAPIMVNGRLLADGGLLNPVPVDAVTAVEADLTVAVSLSGWSPRDFSATPAKASSEARPPAEWVDTFKQSAAGIFSNEWVASVLSWFGRGAEPATDAAELPPVQPQVMPAPPGLGITAVAGLALDTMGGLITRFRLAAQPPDVLVTVPTDAAGLLDFHRADELIELGRRLTIEALDAREPEPDEPAASTPEI
ncbi:MAG: patatin-like phospholipase family protein [Propionibacteriaceae bacterium]|nr:patatin-like phospholipase family protein [Propionibacteriaceae bacterium]